jgi:hypothetical protein
VLASGDDDARVAEVLDVPPVVAEDVEVALVDVVLVDVLAPVDPRMPPHPPVLRAPIATRHPAGPVTPIQPPDCQALPRMDRPYHA